MKKRYYNTPCSVFTQWVSKVRWTQVPTLTPLYENIKCAMWSKSKDYEQSQQAIQTDTNELNIVVDSIYSWIAIWDIFVINNKYYKVINDPVPHERSNWVIDNYEIFVNRTTKNAN